MADLKTPPGAGLLGYMCVPVWQKLLCTLLHQREHMMNLLLSFSMLWADPTRLEPSAQTVKWILLSLKQKPPMTWKTVLMFPHTVKQKIKWWEWKPQNHTTILKPISISLPLEMQFLCVLVAAGLCSDTNLSAVFKTDTKQIQRPHENQMCTCAIEEPQTYIVLILLEGNSRYILWFEILVNGSLSEQTNAIQTSRCCVCQINHGQAGAGRKLVVFFFPHLS